MKSNLIKLNKKEFIIKLNDKKFYAIGGAYYCPKCAYQLKPVVLKEKKGFGETTNIYLDIVCLCDQLK